MYYVMMEMYQNMFKNVFLLNICYYLTPAGPYIHSYMALYWLLLTIILLHFSHFQLFPMGRLWPWNISKILKMHIKITFFLSKTKLKLMFGKVKRYDKLDFASRYVYFGMDPSTHQNRVIFKWFSIQTISVFKQKIHENMKNLFNKKIMSTKQD